jgi:hypothetical protein
VSLPVPHPSRVIRYAYLWYDEHVRGQEEGIKDRPCVIVLAKHSAGENTMVTVAPITHTPPLHPEEAVEIPLPTKQRLGLDTARSWVMVNEVNRFLWPGPDIRPIPERSGTFAYGDLPPALFRQMKERLLTLAHAERVKPVARSQ